MGRYIFAVVSLAASLMALEMTLRSSLGAHWIVMPLVGTGPRTSATNLGALEPDPVVGFRGVPNARLRYRHVEHHYGLTSCCRNNLGCHMRENVRIGKPAKVFRILVLGDSQTEGLGTNDTEETYPYLLQQNLLRIRRAPWRIEIVNGAVAGYSPWHYFLWYKRYGERLNPDLVILGFYTGNDIFDLLAIDHVSDSMDSYTAFCRSPCKLWFVAKRAFTRPSRNRHLLSRMSRMWNLQQSLREKRNVLSQSLSSNYFQKLYPAQFSSGLERAKAILDLFGKEMKKSGKPWLVALLPTKLQVEPEEDSRQISETMRLLNLSPGDLTAEERVEDVVTRFCLRKKMGFIDLKPILIKAHRTTGMELYGYRHWHLNASGNQVVAAALANFLTRNQRLPWSPLKRDLR